jgi:hypothetical protein
MVLLLHSAFHSMIASSPARSIASFSLVCLMNVCRAGRYTLSSFSDFAWTVIQLFSMHWNTS